MAALSISLIIPGKFSILDMNIEKKKPNALVNQNATKLNDKAHENQLIAPPCEREITEIT